MYFTVYQIIDMLNEKIYIGVHQTEELDDGYMGSGSGLQRAQLQYGMENFTKEILHIFDTYNEMMSKEIELVNREFVLREDTYNLTTGGTNGWKILNENGGNLYGKNGTSGYGLENLIHGHQQKERMIQKGTWVARNEKIRQDKLNYFKTNPANFLGMKHTEETKKQMSESSIGTGLGKTNSQYGKCWIYNRKLKQNKSIKKDDLNIWIDQGWEKGMRPEYYPKKN